MMEQRPEGRLLGLQEPSRYGWARALCIAIECDKMRQSAMRCDKVRWNCDEVR
jgi:hypothetical protein